MSGYFKINVDVSGVLHIVDEIDRDLDRRLAKVADETAKKTKEYIKTLSEQRLKSTKELFLENVTVHREGKYTYIIELGEKAQFIEEGLKPFDMLQKLLASPKAKEKKDGSGKYLIVPFNHSKEPGNRTKYEEKLSVPLKAGLRKNKVALRKLDYESDGKTLKTGLLKTLNIDTPKRLGKKTDTSPRLARVNVYQTLLKDDKGNPKLDNKGRQKGVRTLMTFRTASSSQAGTGKWQHPGIKPARIMQDADQYAMETLHELIQKEFSEA